MNDTAKPSQPSVEQMKIARVYAQAAWAAASKQNAQASLVEEIDSVVADVLDGHPQLEILFDLGTVSQERRSAILRDVFEGRASPLVYNFLRTLNAHDRLGLLRAVALSLREIQSAAEGKTPVLVRTAKPLTEAQAQKIHSLLVDNFAVRPALSTEVDPRLLGGLWLRVGETVYDRSVRRDLEQLSDSILTRSSNEIQSGRDIVDHSA